MSFESEKIKELLLHDNVLNAIFALGHLANASYTEILETAIITLSKNAKTQQDELIKCKHLLGHHENNGSKASINI